MRFPIVLHTDDSVHYGVTVPDLPDCFSAGDSIENALECVKEAIDLHLEGLTDDGDDVPLPLPIAQHINNPDYAGGIWAVIDVDVSRFDGRSEKINITVPRRVLARIDRYAKKHGATRSGFLVEAARRIMAEQP